MRNSTFVLLFIVLLLRNYSTMMAGINHAALNEMDGKELRKLASNYFDTREMPDSAMICYSILAARYDDSLIYGEDVDNAIDGMLNVGYIYQYYYYDFQKAYAFLELARVTSLKHNIPKYLPHIYHNLANLYQSIGQTIYSDEFDSSSLNEYKMAFDAAINSNNASAAIMSLNAIIHNALLYNQCDIITEQLSVFKRAAKNFNHPLLKYTLLHSKAAEAYIRHDYNRTTDYLYMMGNVVPQDDLQNIRFNMMAQLETAHLYKNLEDIPKALELNDSVIANAKRINAHEALVDSYKLNSDLYALMKDTIKSKEYYILYLQQKDSLLVNHRLGSVNRLKFLNEIENVNAEVRDLTTKRHRQSVIILISIGIIIIIIAFLFVFARNNRKIKQQNRILFDKANESLQKEKLLIEQSEYYKGFISFMLEPNETSTDIKKTPKYNGSTLSDNEKMELWEKLTTIMNKNQMVFSEDFSMSVLAELASANYKNVSQVINEMSGDNFNRFLAEYRIKEACSRLKDHEHFGHYTIEGIGRSVGFKSRSNFVAIFKKIVGISPSEFKKIAMEGIR